MTNNIIIKYPGESENQIQVESDLQPTALLETIFNWFNAGSNNECKYFLANKMRSLSVGDFVSINGIWYKCMPVGWKMENPA